MDFIKKNKFKILCALILVALCAALAQKKYYILIMCLIGIYTIVGSGLDILFGYSGQISFGHAGFFAIGAYTSALLTTKLGLAPIFAMLVGSVLAIFAALLLAIPACKLRKHFLSMLTIAFGQIIMQLANSFKFTGGANGVFGIPAMKIFGYTLSSRISNLIFIAILTIILLVIKNRIINSRTGRALIAIKENTTAAQGMGINIRRYKTMAFAISAVYAAIGGSLYAHVVGYISPDTFTGVQSTLFMTTLLFGGTTSLIGPFIGAAVVLPIKEIFQSFAYYQGFVYAIFTLIVLFILPSGVAGAFSKIKSAVKRLNRERSNGNA